MAFSRQYESRLLAVEALAAVRSGKGEATSLDAAAHSFEQMAAQLEETDALGRAYINFAALLKAMAYLTRWALSVRTAELGAERYLVAAKQGARDFGRRARAPIHEAYATSPRPHAHDAVEFPTSTRRLIEVAAAIKSVNGVDDIEHIAERLLSIPFPIPIIERPARRDRALLGATPAETTEPEPQVAVAFLTFRINGAIVPDPIIFQPDVLYDLELEARLSRWPTGATRIEFSPVHVEPPGTLLAPVFVIDRPTTASDDAEPLTLRVSGRVRVHCAQDYLARPLEIRYVASVEVEEAVAAHRQNEDRLGAGDQFVVQGQRQLSLQSFDPRLNPITGFREVDDRLIGIRTEARRIGVADSELADFLTLLGAVGRLAGQALGDDLYPGVWSEDDFQDDVRDRLRAIREIGAALEEHPRAGGGITDLSFHKIRLELKADDLGNVTVDTAVARYGQQTAQYISGSDRRCGVLAVLDTEAKSTAPGSVYNDVALRLIPTTSGGGRELLIGVVVVRGNLATPSDLSKAGVKHNKTASRPAHTSTPPA